MKKSSIFALVRDMLLEYKPLAKHLFWVIPITILLVAVRVSEPYIYKLIFDELGASTFVPSHIGPLVLLISSWGVCVFVSIALGFVLDFWFHRLMQSHWAVIIGRGMRAFLMRPYAYHIATNNAEKIKVFNRGVDSIYDAANEVILNMLKNLLLCIGFIALCYITSPVVTITLLVVIPVVFILPIVLGTKAHAAQKHASDKWDQVYSRAGDSMLNVLVVKLFTRIGFDVSELESRVRTAALVQRKVSVYWAFLEAGGQAIHLIISLAVMLASLYFYSRGIIGLGDIVLFVAVSGKLTGPFLQLEWSYRSLVRFAADYAKYQEVLHAPSETDSGTRVFPGIQDVLKFDGVSFVYPGTERKVLSDVHLEFTRGTKTALVGHTGSGKSTLASLFSRFYDPISGSIQADGVDLREFSLESFRGKIAAVFQDTTLFNDTLANNLGYVREGITLDQIKQACADANVLEFIESLPEGFETMVGERGLKLSGGEKQRIAIARAILANPEILILDEATSALDAKTEKLVSDALEKLMTGRTSIIIAHRLSTIQHADKIYLLEQWEVIGSGSHTELYDSSPVYKEMVDYQKHGFIE